MASFSGALASEQIDAVVHYMRGFCKEKEWPCGELNLPRALATEKAYPEDEVVVTSTLNVHGMPGIANEIVHEHVQIQRFSQRHEPDAEF